MDIGEEQAGKKPCNFEYDGIEIVAFSSRKKENWCSQEIKQVVFISNKTTFQNRV